MRLSKEPHYKVCRGCNESRLQQVCGSIWWMVCGQCCSTKDLCDKYGKSALCGSDGEGGDLANQVYSVDQLLAHVDTSLSPRHNLDKIRV